MAFSWLVTGALGTIGITALLLLFPATREFVFQAYGTLKDWIIAFFNILPPIAKIFVVLFLFLFVIGSIVNFFTGTLFLCDGSNVYKPDNFFTSINLGFLSIVPKTDTFGNFTENQYKEILENKSILYQNPSIQKPEGLFQIRCKQSIPKLTLWGIPIFDFRTWILLIGLGGLLKLYFIMEKN